MTPNMQPNPSRIMSLASIFQDSAVLFAASDLGIFTALSKAGTATAASVAHTLGLDERATGLLLNAAVAVGLVEKDGECFRNTPESDLFLVAGRKGDLSSALLYMRDVYPAWGRLPGLVKIRSSPSPGTYPAPQVRSS